MISKWAKDGHVQDLTSKWDIGWGWGLSTSQSTSHPPVWRHRMHMDFAFIEVDIEHTPQFYRVSSILRGAHAISKESSKDGIELFFIQIVSVKCLYLPTGSWALEHLYSSWWFYRYLALILRNVTQKSSFLLSFLGCPMPTPVLPEKRTILNFKGSSSSHHHFSVYNSLVIGGPVLYTLYFTCFCCCCFFVIYTDWTFTVPVFLSRIETWYWLQCRMKVLPSSWGP